MRINTVKPPTIAGGCHIIRSSSENHMVIFKAKIKAIVAMKNNPDKYLTEIVGSIKYHINHINTSDRILIIVFIKLSFCSKKDIIKLK